MPDYDLLLFLLFASAQLIIYGIIAIVIGLNLGKQIAQRKE